MRDLQKINMVRNQCKPSGIENDRLLKALLEVDREDFLLEIYKDLAYSDGEWLDSDGNLMPRPEMQGQLLDLADLESEDKVLIIGSSYLAAVASLLVEKVTVIGDNSLNHHYSYQVIPFELEKIPQGYNKLIIEKILSKDEMNTILQAREIAIFYPESQGVQISQKLYKSYQGEKYYLGEIYLPS